MTIIRIFYFIAILFSLHVSAYAHVELTYPEGSETFYSGDTIKIQWVQVQAHDAQNWELYFSPDGAETWEVISINIAAGLREYDWVVPDEETTKGRIKVVQNNTDTDYEDVSTNLKIVTITRMKEHQHNASVNSLSNYPNPFLHETKFRFLLYEKAEVSLEILQFNGRKVITLINDELSAGEHIINWKAGGKMPGVYAATLTIGNKQKTIKLLQLAP